MRLYFRADGSETMGLGHVYRCLALACAGNAVCTFGIRRPSQALVEMLSSHGFGLDVLSADRDYVDEAAMLANRLTGFDAIVMDGYNFNSVYQKTLKSSDAIVISVDDMHDGHFYSDAVFNHAPGLSANDFSSEDYTKLFLGPEYTMIREPFASFGKRGERTRGNGLLICMGGSDPLNLSNRLLTLLQDGPITEKITVVTGSAYQHTNQLNEHLAVDPRIVHRSNLTSQEMFEEFREASVALVPASTVLFEALASKTITLAGHYVDNQKSIYSGFSGMGLVIELGDLNHLSRERLHSGLTTAFENTSAVQTLYQRMESAFDGGARARISHAFDQLINDRS